jgi:hypothetical protein
MWEPGERKTRPRDSDINAVGIILILEDVIRTGNFFRSTPVQFWMGSASKFQLVCMIMAQVMKKVPSEKWKRRLVRG